MVGLEPTGVGATPTFPTTLSERSAVWLAHLLWEQRVEGSNPSVPTIYMGIVM